MQYRLLFKDLMPIEKRNMHILFANMWRILEIHDFQIRISKIFDMIFSAFLFCYLKFDQLVWSTLCSHEIRECIEQKNEYHVQKFCFRLLPKNVFRFYWSQYCSFKFSSFQPPPPRGEFLNQHVHLLLAKCHLQGAFCADAKVRAEIVIQQSLAEDKSL